MAVFDENNRRIRTGDRIRNGLSGRTEGAGVLLIVAALIAAASICLWLYTRGSNDGVGVTRTTPPVTSSPNTGSNPTTTPKQPQ